MVAAEDEEGREEGVCGVNGGRRIALNGARTEVRSIAQTQDEPSPNRWCQLADFRERGGLSFELRAVASESDSPSGRSAIYYDAQFPSLS